MKKWLTEQGYEFVHNKPFPQTAYHPDFLFHCDGYIVIVENDEHAHSRYDPGCERYREENIRYAAGVPTLFIRYNPDNKKYTDEYKLAELKAAIDWCLSCQPEESETIYLFYPER